MDLLKTAAGLFLVLAIISFSIYFLSPFLVRAILGDGAQYACGRDAEIAYQSCISMQKSGLLIGCIPPICPILQNSSAAAGAIFAFISACCGVYRLYSGNLITQKK
jgi:ABC-type multidrug transport system permease subunit